MASINEYARTAASFWYPIPVRTVNNIIAPAPGAAGVPTEAISANNAIITILPTVTS